ncbi:MAG: hypothetical protein R3E79_47420 [Caldilineaceae bacterium]
MVSHLTLACGAGLLGIWLYCGGWPVWRGWRRPGSPEADEPISQWVRVSRAGAVIDVPMQALQAGDTVVVCSGGIIPVDGVIIAGAAWIDDPPAGGGSRRQVKKLHHRVCANRLVLAGSITVQIELPEAKID